MNTATAKQRAYRASPPRLPRCQIGRLKPIRQLQAGRTQRPLCGQHRYLKLDVHIPMVDVLPMLACEELEMKFPEATLRGHVKFEGWYQAGRGVHFLRRSPSDKGVKHPDGAALM